MDPRDTLSALKIDREQNGPGERRRRWPLIVLALAVAAGAVGGGWWYLTPRPVTVRTVTAEIEGGGVAGTVLNASGYVVAQQQATVAAQITGMVVAVYVHEGDRVREGQILARLDDSAAQAAVAAARSQLSADQDLVPQYQAQLVRDTRTLERNERLAHMNAISQSALDDARAAARVDTAQLAHARGQVDVDRNNLALQQTELSFTVIRAPFAGVVTERYAHPGEMISPQAVGGFTQTGICKIVDMTSLEIDVDVNEAYIQRIRDGQSVDAVLDAYPNWTIPAHVISVVPTANEQKATVKVRIGFEKLDPRILPQMSVQVRFVAGEAASGPAIPAQIRLPLATLHGPVNDRFVFVVDDGKAVIRRVRMRRANTGGAIVLKGLDGGERVVLSSAAPLKDGEEVREQ